MPDYLKPKEYLTLLRNAENSHQLDAKAVLEKLSEAVKFCDKKTDEYMIAKGIYLNEVRNRVRAQGQRGGVGFGAWCRENGIAPAYATAVAAIGKSRNKKAALEHMRGGTHGRRKRKNLELSQLDKPHAMFRIWRSMTEPQRQEFLAMIGAFVVPLPALRNAIKTRDDLPRNRARRAA